MSKNVKTAAVNNVAAEIDMTDKTIEAVEPKKAQVSSGNVVIYKPNTKVVGLNGEIVEFDGEGKAKVSKEQFDYLLSIPCYKSGK